MRGCFTARGELVALHRLQLVLQVEKLIEELREKRRITTHACLVELCASERSYEVAGTMPCAVWYALSAANVRGPKVPVGAAILRNPSAMRIFWSSVT